MAAATWVEPRRARHVDAAMDRVDPGGAAVGHHHAGGAEDGKPADDAQPTVEGLRRQRLAARNGDGDRHVRRPLRLARDLLDHLPHHLPRHRVDCRLARRDRQPCARHRPNAFTGMEGDPGPRRIPAHRCPHKAAMRDVGVVAGILDDCRCGGAGLQASLRQGEAGRAPTRQADGHRIGETPAGQRTEGSLHRRRGARTRGPAAPQRRHHARHSALPARGRAHRALDMWNPRIMTGLYQQARALAAP